MQFDDSLQELAQAAFNENNDVFLQCFVQDFSKVFFSDVRTAVLLPGSVFVKGCERLMTAEIESFYDVYTDGKNIIADIRMMSYSSFREYLTRNYYRRLVVPFSECADVSEYGHTQAFLWIREYKAEISHFCQLLAFISPSYRNVRECISAYTDTNAVFVGKYVFPDIKAYSCSSAVSKFYCTASEIEKYALGKQAVFFNSRNEAAEFCVFMNKRGNSFVYLDGAVNQSERLRRLEEFASDNAQTLIATKSGISLLPFVSVDRVIFCGMPFSAAHIGRTAFACRTDSVKVIFSESDIVRNKKILMYFAEKETQQELFDKRLEKLSEISDIINQIIT